MDKMRDVAKTFCGFDYALTGDMDMKEYEKIVVEGLNTFNNCVTYLLGKTQKGDGSTEIVIAANEWIKLKRKVKTGNNNTEVETGNKSIDRDENTKEEDESYIDSSDVSCQRSGSLPNDDKEHSDDWETSSTESEEEVGGNDKKLSKKRKNGGKNPGGDEEKKTRKQIKNDTKEEGFNVDTTGKNHCELLVGNGGIELVANVPVKKMSNWLESMQHKKGSVCLSFKVEGKKVEDVKIRATDFMPDSKFPWQLPDK